MSETALTPEELSFPLGRFARIVEPSAAEVASWIDDLEALPNHLRAAVAGLDDSQLDTPYRPGGWSVRQLVHHVADSHANAYIRFKLALTEDEPPIRAYQEKLWAELPDSRLPVAISLDLTTALHGRWVHLLRHTPESQLERRFLHPVTGPWTLRQALGLYAWHSRHHTAHVTRLRGWHGW
jgi:uncharacterized damage-inducible protein DinB